MFVYTLRAEFPDVASRARYLAWLRGGHAAAIVSQGGALRTEVTEFDDGAVETRCLFASREAFDAYEAGPAIALRADGVAKFPPSSGIRTTRTHGVIHDVIT